MACGLARRSLSSLSARKGHSALPWRPARFFFSTRSNKPEARKPTGPAAAETRLGTVEYLDYVSVGLLKRARIGRTVVKKIIAAYQSRCETLTAGQQD
jgi:hypothetical protein